MKKKPKKKPVFVNTWVVIPVCLVAILVIAEIGFLNTDSTPAADDNSTVSKEYCDAKTTELNDNWEHQHVEDMKNLVVYKHASRVLANENFVLQKKLEERDHGIAHLECQLANSVPRDPKVMDCGE